jgi:Zn-dependent protease with chaperone function
MPSTAALIVMGLLAQVVGGPNGIAPASTGAAYTPARRPGPSGTALPGREADVRVAAIAFRLAEAGRTRCPAPLPAIGLVLQHLSQFHPADRAGIIAALPLDRGPGVIAIVAGGPAAMAGLRTGDVLLAIEGVPIPIEAGLGDPFDAVRAQARNDAVDDLLIRMGDRPFAITVLRDGTRVSVRLAPRLICPSRVRLARSNQRNAFADGRHVFLTTGVLNTVRSDDELAFVIGHEMAHNILDHAAVMRRDEVRHGLGRTLGHSGQIIRDTERAADRLAGDLMLDAGFDPVAGIEVLRRLGGVDLGIKAFASHAPVKERIAAMRTLVIADRTR